MPSEARASRTGVGSELAERVAWSMLAAVGDWWWWTGLVLLPPLAAMASAPFGLDRIPPWRRWVLIGLAAVGVGVVIWWYGFAR